MSHHKSGTAVFVLAVLLILLLPALTLWCRPPTPGPVPPAPSPTWWGHEETAVPTETPMPTETAAPTETAVPSPTPTQAAVPTATPTAEPTAVPSPTPAMHQVRPGDTYWWLAYGAYGRFPCWLFLREVNGYHERRLPVGAWLLIPEMCP